MNKALLYSTAEGVFLELFKPIIEKTEFVPENYNKILNTDYSQIYDEWVESYVLLIKPHKVFSLWFEDGMCWDTERGWRKMQNQKDYVLEVYNKKLTNIK